MKSEYLGFLLTLRFTLTLGAGDHPYEWGGIFETPESNYMWTAQKVNQNYADPSLTMVAWPVTTFTKEALHALEEQAEDAMNMTCTDVQAGGTIVPASNTCFRLVFQQIAWQSLYNIDASSAAGIAFFTNHVPTEFEATAHYLKDDHGDDIEPKATIPEAAAKATEETTDWGPPMLGALTVNLATFIGVFLLFPPVKKMSARPLFGAMLFAFAAGALLACAFFLLLFEATHLVAVGWSAEVDVVWRWGTMILAGLVLPPVVETICSIIMLAVKGGSAASPSGEESSVEAGNSVEARKAETEDPVAKFRATARLVGAVVIGDFFHNLCDGFFIGAAFKGCGNSFGWSVIVGTILHELPQEVADFVILTGPDVALGIAKALAANFISGTSVLIGTAIVLSAQVDDATIGLILAFGGGVYLHLGATDCLPKLYDPKLGFGQRLAAFAAFVLGAIVIGLILIGHEHCVPEGSEGHGGHGGGHGDAHGGGH